MASGPVRMQGPGFEPGNHEGPDPKSGAVDRSWLSLRASRYARRELNQPDPTNLVVLGPVVRPELRGGPVATGGAGLLLQVVRVPAAAAAGDVRAAATALGGGSGSHGTHVGRWARAVVATKGSFITVPTTGLGQEGNKTRTRGECGRPGRPASRGVRPHLGRAPSAGCEQGLVLARPRGLRDMRWTPAPAHRLISDLAPRA